MMFSLIIFCWIVIDSHSKREVLDIFYTGKMLLLDILFFNLPLICQLLFFFSRTNGHVTHHVTY